FFQAEDGIRDDLVTGVQTCALPICWQLAMMMPINGSLYEIPGEQAGVCRDISPYPIPTLPVVASPVISGQYDWCSNALLMYECKIGRASCRERVLMMVVVVLLENEG